MTLQIVATPARRSLEEVSAWEAETVKRFLGDLEVAQTFYDPDLGRVHHAPDLSGEEFRAALHASRWFPGDNPGTRREWSVITPRANAHGDLFIYFPRPGGGLWCACCTPCPDGGGLSLAGAGRVRPRSRRGV